MKETVKYFKGSQNNGDNTVIFETEYSTPREINTVLRCMFHRLKLATKLIFISLIIIKIGFDWAFNTAAFELNILELALLSLLFMISSYNYIMYHHHLSTTKELLKMLLILCNFIFLILLTIKLYPNKMPQLIGSLNITQVLLSILLSLPDIPEHQLRSSIKTFSGKEILSALLQDSNLKGNKLFMKDLSKIVSFISKESEEKLAEPLISDPDTISNLSALKELDKVDFITFNIFNLKAQTNDNELLLMQKYVYDFYEFSDLSFRAVEFLNFSLQVQGGYLANHYHNATHAADVLHSIHLMLSPFQLKDKLSPYLYSALLIGGAVHDFQHPGRTNGFLIKTSDKLAMLYNDISVLENFHISSALDLINSNISCNFLQDLDQASYFSFRKYIIKIVLATDFSFHDHHLQKAKNIKITDEELNNEEQAILAELIMHTCDILNPARPWEICLKWANLIFEEYFAQGDLERSLGLPISPLCDRLTVVIPSSQIYFINNFVCPSVLVLEQFSPDLQILIKTLQGNLEKWTLFPNNS